VVPAYRDFASFLAQEYGGRARSEVGVHAIPGGREAYAFAIRVQTTTDLTADAIHRIGLEELEKNKKEMLEIGARGGHAGDLRSYLDGLMADPRFRLKTREALLERYRAILERMDAALPGAFGILPETPYRVEGMPAYKEKDAPAAYYYPPSEDGKRPGIFFANLHDPPSWPTYEMETLSYHEAVPGHHLQIAVALERRHLPAVRRHSLYTAYVEGWAHYAERLAEEMGMFTADEDRVGMLAGQAWRAARLVVDTGMHHLGWPRERAVAVLREIKTGPEQETQNEIDRYIVWPGQALAYKVGHRKILELREEARAALGDRFTLAGFHDEVLRHGALPLSVLEEVVRGWAAAKARKKAG
jgi:prolyl oligopeptidase